MGRGRWACRGAAERGGIVECDFTIEEYRNGVQSCAGGRPNDVLGVHVVHVLHRSPLLYATFHCYVVGYVSFAASRITSITEEVAPAP